MSEPAVSAPLPGGLRPPDGLADDEDFRGHSTDVSRSDRLPGESIAPGSLRGDGITEPNDLDAMPFDDPAQPPRSLAAPEPRKCKRHSWRPARREDTYQGDACSRCGQWRDLERSRRGRTARRRGNGRELELARALDGEKVGHHGGPEDVRAGMFNVQSKVRGNFPGWMLAELRKLPRTGGRVPLLIVTGPAGADPSDLRRRPALAIVELSDWRDLHGSEVAT